MRWILSLIIIVGVGVQIIFFPWLSIFSSQAPLALIIVVAASLIRVNYVIPTALATGVLLDLQGGHSLGFWTVYYGLAGVALNSLLRQPNPKWWWRVAWLAAVICLQLWYGQLPHLRWSLTGLLLSLILAAIGSAIVAVPCYYLHKREMLT